MPFRGQWFIEPGALSGTPSIALVVACGAMMRSWVQDNDDAFDPDHFEGVPFVGGVLLLVWSFVRYAQLRRARGLPVALARVGGAATAAVAGYVLEVR